MASKKSTSKKKSTKKGASYYPVVRSAPLSAGAAANTVVDGARILSTLNRRLMRMGRNYEFKVNLRPDYAGTAIEVYVLRNDWAVQKAFQEAYKAYQKATADERQSLSSVQIARWEDFRVSHGLTIPVNQARAVLHTPAGGASNLNSGEFDLSQVTIGDDTQRTWTWGVPGATQFGILQEFNFTGSLQTDPSVVHATAPYADLETDDDQQTALDLQNHGNLPPYEETGVNEATPWVRVGVLGAGAAGQQRLSTGFFTAPCGFVLLKGFTETSEAYSVEIEAKSGDYKGVHAPSMLE